MRIVLGNKEAYNLQTNDATVDFTNDYGDRPRIVACGPNSLANGLEICGHDMSVFTPGEQASDGIMMVAHNRKHLPKYTKRRKLDYDVYPPNEIPQLYEIFTQIIYGNKKVCKYYPGISFRIIKNAILRGSTLMISGEFPAGGHFVTVVGFDDEKQEWNFEKKVMESKQVIIFNDPYPDQWDDENGYNREMSLEWFRNHINNYRVEIFKAENKRGTSGIAWNNRGLTE
jgi:hypothetical protein